MRLFCLLSIGILLGSCSKNNPVIESPEIIPSDEPSLEAPFGFSPVVFPDDNPYSKEKWELGKRLFFDPMLSEDFSISCASCHEPTLAFSDNLAVSKGVGGIDGRRNAPSLSNLSYHPYYTREGGIPTLEMQVLIPIQEHDEFNFNIVLVAERMAEDPSYVEASLEIFGREPDAYVITRAIATFERTLISGQSPYDYFQETGIGLTEAQLNGLELFFSEATNCSNCHGGFNFTSYSFENNGLYVEYEDEGRYRLTADPEDVALFKVPSLRNIAITGPYMHDGSINSLKDVLDHYNEGGHAHPHKNELIRPLNLSTSELEDLESFLNTLTDEHFISNELFQNN